MNSEVVESINQSIIREAIVGREMSWLRSAINRAAEVGGKNIAPNLSRTVRNVAQQAGHAVAGGAKLVQDRLSGRNLNSLKHAVRRLDEVALNARGTERVQALARWLAVLKEIGKDITTLSQADESGLSRFEGSTPSGASDEIPSPRRASMVLFYDFENDGEPINFREVFLRSRAIENIVTSMILEAPVDEEVIMLLEIFGLCLAGGKELHNAIISSIQDLAKAIASYTEEVMIRKDELLKYAQDAVTGLKLNADVERFDAQISFINQQIAERQGKDSPKEIVVSSQSSVASTQNANEEASVVLHEFHSHLQGSKTTDEILQLHLKLGDLLQRKRSLLHGGDSPQVHTDKVEQLKSVTESLIKSTAETEKLIIDNKNQKEAALKYRAIKTQEVEEAEKVIAAEIKILEKKREELEAELKEVKSALAAVTGRHINTQEEKEQFDEASTNVIAHLEVQEDELQRSLAAKKTEIGAVDTWLSFLEDTWHLQTTYTELSTIDVEKALGETKNQYSQSLIKNLSYRKEELNVLLKQLKLFSDELKIISNQRGNVGDPETNYTTSESLKDKRKIQEFFEAEGQIISILKAVDVLRKDLQSSGTMPLENYDDVENSVLGAFYEIDKLQREFAALPRPDVELMNVSVTASQVASSTKLSVRWADVSSGEHENSANQSLPSLVHLDDSSHVTMVNELQRSEDAEFLEDAEVQDLTELQGKKNNVDFSHDETAGWEFDELEEELEREGV